MYKKSWHYYRDLLIVAAFVLALAGAGLAALAHPVWWMAFLPLWMVQSAVRNAFTFAHPPRRLNRPPPSPLEFREVTFRSRDGLTLFGRFASGTNRAAVILAHALGSAGRDMVFHAETLARAGFSVFLIDLRAHGSSDGDTSTFGLREADDVAGAADYLLTRLDVDGRRIGALGISLGAQAVLRGALRSGSIAALAVDALGPSNLSDHGGRPQDLLRWINYPYNWLYYRLYEFMIGGREAGVLEVIGRVAPRPILFIACGGRDLHFSRRFYRAAGEPKELWELPRGAHGAAFMEDPQEYRRRVVGFFNKTLGVLEPG